MINVYNECGYVRLLTSYCTWAIHPSRHRSSISHTNAATGEGGSSSSTLPLTVFMFGAAVRWGVGATLARGMGTPWPPCDWLRLRAIDTACAASCLVSSLDCIAAVVPCVPCSMPRSDTIDGLYDGSVAVERLLSRSETVRWSRSCGCPSCCVSVTLRPEHNGDENPNNQIPSHKSCLHVFAADSFAPAVPLLLLL